MKSKKLADMGDLSSQLTKHSNPTISSETTDNLESSRKGPPGARLKVLSNNLSAIEILMLRHGQLLYGPGARPIVPRCMTAFPENFAEFLESQLPLEI